jgi:hypothetical protein
MRKPSLFFIEFQQNKQIPRGHKVTKKHGAAGGHNQTSLSQPPAAPSRQPSAVSPQLSEKRSQHPLYLPGAFGQLLMFIISRKTKISRQQNLVLQLTRRVHRNLEEVSELTFSDPTATLRQVRGNRNGCSPHLAYQTVELILWEVSRRLINRLALAA